MPVDAIRKHAGNFSLEFRLLLHLDEASKRSARQGRGARYDRKASSKDRCSSVVPFEEHRVWLPGNKYINASPVPDGFGRVFLAAQGPLRRTVSDFWQMAAHHRVRRIVSLCCKDECDDYLPREDEPQSHLNGALEVRLKGGSTVPGVPHLVRRILEVRHLEGSPWEIVHLQHLAWPDHGEVKPASVLPVLELLGVPRDPRGVAVDDSPVLVHCRAGVGRTGCFIALCSLVASVDQQSRQSPREIPRVSVLKTVLELRTYRPHMVQTPEQYQLLYSTLQEWVRSRGAGVGGDARLSGTADDESRRRRGDGARGDGDPAEGPAALSAAAATASEGPAAFSAAAPASKDAHEHELGRGCWDLRLRHACLRICASRPFSSRSSSAVSAAGRSTPDAPTAAL